MADDAQATPDINGLYWVLFRSTGKDTFEYLEVARNGKRAILVFTSQDKAQAYTAQNKSHAIEAQFNKEYKPITLDSLVLWRDFLHRRANEGVCYVEVNLASADLASFQTSIGDFIHQFEEP